MKTYFTATVMGWLFTTFLALAPSATLHGEDDPRPVVDDSKAIVQTAANPNLPTLYVVGDSTARSNDPLRGWGSEIGAYFDPAKINVVNRAIGGRSSRTFMTEGRWDKVLAELKPGDFVMVQFGHNDSGNYNDPKAKGRPSIRGEGEDTAEAIKGDLVTMETIHSFGWYMRKYASDAKAKGATPILLSMVPHKIWQGDKISRGEQNTFVTWTRNAAKTTGALFIDTNTIIAEGLERLGPDKVNPLFGDARTHSTPEGAKYNASAVVAGLKALNPDDPLAKYFSKSADDLPLTLAASSTSEPVHSSTPEPTPEATAAAPPEPTATPISKPASTPAPDPLSWIVAHKDFRPKQVILIAPAEFPVVFEGRIAGKAQIPAGTTVDLVEISSKNVAVAYKDGGLTVPIDSTNLRQLATQQMAKAETAPEAIPTPAPSKTPTASQESGEAAPVPQRNPTPSLSDESLSGQSVTLHESEQGIVLSNGIVTATINKKADVSSFKYKGFEMTTGMYYSMDGGANYRTPGGGEYFIKTNTPDLIDIGFKNIRKNEPQAFDCEVHYALKRGSSGLYTYAVLSHPADYPKTGYGEWRFVWKLSNDLLEKIYVDDLRHWQMPSSEDYKSAEKTGIKEIEKITTGVRAGQFDCKYDFNASYYDIGCWGHASDTHKVGGWIVLGGYDFFNDGPTKQDLNAASGINHIHFGMNHYGGSTASVEAGEEWRKIYGPFLLYCNHSEQGGDAMWADAKKEAEIEKAAWPYAWLTDNTAYPAADARGTLAGHLVIKDSLKPKLSAANAWIGLAQPPTGGNWQFESNHYQYWAKADATGNFTIPGVRPGTYTFYVFTDGAVGEFSRENVGVKEGANKLPEEVVWEVPHKGRSIAWEIGTPDRSAKEFRHGTDYFHGYVWTHFQEEFTNPLEYTVGKSDWSKDWNYAQSWYQTGDKRVPWRWRIHFDLATVPPGDATMTFAFAGAHGGARIDVYVNDDNKPFGTVTPSVQGGNALLRESIHAKYCVEYLTIPTSRLKQGANTITLEQTKTDTQSHVMYDYINLELP